MRGLLLACLLVLALAPGAARGGEVGSTLGKYSVAGAGVGAFLGSAAATLPYLQSKNSYDILTGAGIGMLGGTAVGFILGMVDLANPKETDAAAGRPEGWNLAWQPSVVSASWTMNF